MDTLALLILLAGIAISLIGYWFLGKSTGEQEFNNNAYTPNEGGGWAGIIIGGIIMIMAFIYNRYAEAV